MGGGLPEPWAGEEKNVRAGPDAPGNPNENRNTTLPRTYVFDRGEESTRTKKGGAFPTAKKKKRKKNGSGYQEQGAASPAGERREGKHLHIIRRRRPKKEFLPTHRKKVAEPARKRGEKLEVEREEEEPL